MSREGAKGQVKNSRKKRRAGPGVEHLILRMGDPFVYHLWHYLNLHPLEWEECTYQIDIRGNL